MNGAVEPRPALALMEMDDRSRFFDDKRQTTRALFGYPNPNSTDEMTNIKLEISHKLHPRHHDPCRHHTVYFISHCFPRTHVLYSTRRTRY